ncbi:MAG: response regulator transcription factor [Candidatus Kapabacteria bacterium]|nr:response regulator transcription factor [Candidatus Kapabacteria bacterium]MDW8012651.1 response regulator transcription factor [Bacteroidota bacterium]
MHILLIEDERKLAAFLKHVLEEESYSVDVAYDGETGVEMAQQRVYDAIILDIMLPKLDGFAVLSRLRTQGDTTPVIVLTARGTPEERVMGLDLGADDYLPKPFHLEELLARLRSVLRRSSPEKATRLQCGDLILDTRARVAYRGGKEIPLTPREYALLEYLMRHKNQTLSRSLILYHVWSDIGVDSNIVDVYIKRLREKLDVPNAPSLIQTVRGAGYRLREPESAPSTQDTEPKERPPQ